MQNISNISILAMFVMYLLTAIFGYLTFYGNKNYKIPYVIKVPTFVIFKKCFNSQYVSTYV